MEFKDGGHEIVDRVIVCTGYLYHYPFLPESVVQVISTGQQVCFPFFAVQMFNGEVAMVVMMRIVLSTIEAKIQSHSRDSLCLRFCHCTCTSFTVTTPPCPFLGFASESRPSRSLKAKPVSLPPSRPRLRCSEGTSGRSPTS